MIHKTTENTSAPKTRFETCVDHCGQSLFEVWLPVEALEEFEAQIDKDLADLEAKFANFVTGNSRSKRRSR